MYLASLFSGGKDSAFALYKAMQEGHEIKVIITISSENPESYMYHVPNIGLTRLQAEAMSIPIIFKTTEGVKEEELDELIGRIGQRELDPYSAAMELIEGEGFS